MNQFTYESSGVTVAFGMAAYNHDGGAAERMEAAVLLKGLFRNITFIN